MELISQHLVMSRDLNAHGNLFGGTILAWLDESAAIYTMEKILFTNIVTVNMDDINFRAPAKLGDIVKVFASIEKIGNSSITIRSKAFTWSRSIQEEKEIIDCRIVYVCLDSQGKPYPYFKENSDLTKKLNVL